MKEEMSKQESIQQLADALKIWSGDGSLQTFEDRERFRTQARAALAQAKPFLEEKPTVKDEINRLAKKIEPDDGGTWYE